MEPALRQAVLALRSGDLPNADRVCRRLLAARPSHAPALQVLGVVSRRLGRLDEAESLMRRSVDADPGNPEFRSNLGQLLVARGKLADGIAELEQAIALAPGFRPARLELARLANQALDHARAERHARLLVAADERSTVRLATHRRGSCGAAPRVECAPGYATNRQNLATVLAAEEHSEEVLVVTAECDRLGIRDRSLDRARARALIQLDRYDESESVLAHLVAAAPEDLDAHFLLSQLRHIRGDPDFARSIREAADRSDAPLPVRMAYADTMRRSGATAVAEELLRDLIRHHGPRPELLRSLGTVLLEAGHCAEAVTVSMAAAAAQPDSAAAAENMVAALLSAGQARDALPTIERFRARAPQDQRWITYRMLPAYVAKASSTSGATSTGWYASTTSSRRAVMHRWWNFIPCCGPCFRFGTQTSRGLLVRQRPGDQGV